MLLAVAIATSAWADCADPQDNPLPAEDCDGDGWTVGDGDCDDDDATSNPGEVESCDAPADEDCDGLYDDGCDRPVERATLQGGSACGTSPGPAGSLALGLIALLLARRRR